MLRLPSWLKRGGDDPHKDAKALYQILMRQSRKPVFFGPDRVTDDFDGRMEVLALHISLIMAALAPKGEAGPILSQALYDVMVEDFDIALREEGLADTGVSRRIKPMAKMVLTRVKSYSDALVGDTVSKDIAELTKRFCPQEQFSQNMANYTLQTWENIKDLSVGEIAKSKFSFAKI